MDDNTQPDKKGTDQIPATGEIPLNSLPESKTSKAEDDSELVTKALRFLASASTETLVAIALGLSACTYLVLGRIGLVLIGVVGGVVLHATWEGQNAASTEDARREKGLDVVKRILDQRDSKTLVKDKGDAIDATSSFEGFKPETSVAMKELVEVGCKYKRVGGEKR